MEASNHDEILSLYEQTAESYATMMDTEIQSSLYADVLSRLRDRIAGLSGPLIDTSCGSGHMLALYHTVYDESRELKGIDLVPKMVEIAQAKLAPYADIQLGDMCHLPETKDNSAASILSFFSLHHLDMHSVAEAVSEWRRVLQLGGQLVVATWEGAGTIDYGESSDMVAFKHTTDDIRAVTEAAGFIVDRCITEPVEEIGMDAVYLEATAM